MSVCLSVCLPVRLTVYQSVQTYNNLFVYNKHDNGASPELPSTYIWDRIFRFAKLCSAESQWQ